MAARGSGALLAPAAGDRARFRLPDKSVHRGIVTSVNGDGTYAVTEEGTGAVHRLPDNKVKKDDGTPPRPKNGEQGRRGAVGKGKPPPGPVGENSPQDPKIEPN